MTETHTRRRRRWGFLFVEMVLIVASILVAFALDAWWDERGVRAEERMQLDALRDELVESRAALDEVIDSVAQHGRNVDALLALLRGAEGEAVEVPNVLLGSVVCWRTSDVWISTLESMRASGTLRLVSDAGLRNALAAFPGILQDLQEDEAVGRDFVEFVLAGALARHQLAAAAYGACLATAEPARVNAGVADGRSTVRPDEELMGLLVARQVHIVYSELGLPDVHAYMGELIERIDDALR